MTMKKKLITIEGIDCSGKTTIARAIARRIGYRFEHEPTFKSEMADQLNFTEMNSYQREFYFMKDRLNHQEILNKYHVVLDSYILRGLTYAAVFGRKALEMMQSVYQLPDFKQPDLTVVVDIDPMIAYEFNCDRVDTGYNPMLTLEKLTELREAMMHQIKVITHWPNRPPIIVIQNKGTDLPAMIDKTHGIIDTALTRMREAIQ